MPKSASHMLIWSPLDETYILHKYQSGDTLDTIFDKTAAPEWVSRISSFAFRGQNGSYTARKEHKQRGGEYWYAYARIEGKLIKRYLGRNAQLTPTRLEQIALKFSLALHQREGVSPRSGSTPFAHPGETIFLPGDLSEADIPSSSGATHSFAFPLATHRIPGDNNDDARNNEHASKIIGRKAEIPSADSGLSLDTLLVDKIHIPRPRPHLVHRPRLIQRLQQGLDQVLTLLSAPAGFGKTTLLGDWLVSHAVPAAWLSLEPQDNDPARFLAYLLAALQIPNPQLDEAMHALPHRSLESVLARLINALQSLADRDQKHIILVLDNYHVITNDAIHYALADLLEHVPSSLRLVLATREDPPLPLARLRGRDDLLELRTADLRFTHEEAASYLGEMMGLPLSVEETSLLQVRTEGWITGLHLTALSLQASDDPAGFMTTFSGNHHYVADYLLNEVLGRQPQAIQDFLLQTSLLDRLSAPLCDAVLARNDSQVQLTYLEQANLFLVPLDDERRWYRYHHLFAEVLRQRLEQTAPTQMKELHHRASHWFEQHGLFTEAITHALAASEFEETVRLIEQCAWTFAMGYQKGTMPQQLHILPETLTMARPSLRLLYASALMYTHHLAEASIHLHAIEQEMDLAEEARQAPGHLLSGQVIAAQSLLARLCGDLEQCVILSRRALNLLPENEGEPLSRLLRGEAMLGAARSYLVSGDVTAASESVLMELISHAHASGSRLLALGTLNLLAQLQFLQGRLHRAAATHEDIVQAIQGTEGFNAPLDNPAASFSVSELLREWNELDAAERHLVRGMDLLKGMPSVDADTVWLGYASQARLEMTRGWAEQALATLDSFEQLAQQRHFAPVLLAQCATLRAQLELMRGQTQTARRWAESSGVSIIASFSYLREREYLTLARIHIAEERINPGSASLSTVVRLLEQLLGEAEASMRLHSALEVLLLLSLAFEVQGDRTKALVTLGRALALAEPEGYLRLFLDEGPPMLALHHQAQRHGLAPGYVAKILTAAGKTKSTELHHQVLQGDSLMEPLTARERDVLKLVLEGASNREIARQLVLSVNTVKKHVLNIYGKLNAHNRAQAIAKARMLSLLQES